MTRTAVHARPMSRFVALAAALAMLLLGAGSATSASAAAVPAPAPLTNLSHLNFLLDTVPLPAVDGHTTYQIDGHATALAPWTYADRSADGTFRRVGGGDLNTATGYYGQGAFNADDIARAAVVYLRHWRLTGSSDSREHAFQTLRSLTYLQTTVGPGAGNVVLWQQADGALNPSATPAELPDPSDSAESYWLARTVWALGEGYAAFKDADPQFASFLQDRLHLALASLNNAGADASAEAVLGLAAYVKAAPADGDARTAMARLSEGIAAMPPHAC